jgi:hypothetical protein
LREKGKPFSLLSFLYNLRLVFLFFASLCITLRIALHIVYKSLMQCTYVFVIFLHMHIICSFSTHNLQLFSALVLQDATRKLDSSPSKKCNKNFQQFIGIGSSFFSLYCNSFYSYFFYFYEFFS